MRDGTASAAVHSPAAASIGAQPAAPFPSRRYAREPRQAPPQRVFVAPCGPAIVIRPAAPAAVRHYTNGLPTLFQDDLNAIRDHGSPGRLGQADTFGFSNTGSSLR